MQEAIDSLEPFDGPADKFVAHVYMDPHYPIDTRLRAAIAMLPYTKPKLEAVNVYSLAGQNGDATSETSRGELARRIAYLLTSAAQKPPLDITPVQPAQPGETLPAVRFDRNGYQRELMRKRRAAAKG